jgi:DNA-binding NtrC family response regulator
MNVVERAVLLCPGSMIFPEDLGLRNAPRPPHENPGEQNEPCVGRPAGKALRRFTESVERDFLASQLRAAGGNIGDAARRAGLSTRWLNEKMRRYGLRREDFRSASAPGQDAPPPPGPPAR